MEKLPATLGVPETKPVDEFKVTPVGSEPVIEYPVIGEFVAVIW
jgi:hypothetical protein